MPFLYFAQTKRTLIVIDVIIIYIFFKTTLLSNTERMFTTFTTLDYINVSFVQ